MDSDPSENPTEPAGTAVPPPPTPLRRRPSAAAAAAHLRRHRPTSADAGLTTSSSAPPVAPSFTPPPTPPVRPPRLHLLSGLASFTGGGQSRGDRRHSPPPLPQLITELREMVVTYVKQQTIAPLKNLGRYVGFGLARVVALRVRRRVPRALRPPRAPDRDRRHLHRRLVVGALPDHDLRAGGRRRTGLGAPHRRPAARRRPDDTRHRAARQGTITRADIEAKLAEIRGVTDTTTEVAQEATKPILVILGIGLVIGAFLLGRRRGSKRSTIVEVRRV